MFNISMVAFPSTLLSASFISRYISIRLLQRFPLKRLILNISRQMQFAQQHAHIQGFKIACNGRFERRGRATHI
jgi:hypothetical protein